MKQFNKDQIVRRLQSIARQISCMSENEIQNCFQNGIFKFIIDDFICWTEKAKITTKIEMSKTILRDEGNYS